MLPGAKTPKNQSNPTVFLPMMADSSFWNILFKDEIIKEIMIAYTKKTIACSEW